MAFFGFSAGEVNNILIALAIVAVVIIAGLLILRFLLDRVGRIVAGRTESGLDDAILAAARPVLFWLIVVIALDLASDRVPFLLSGLTEQFGDFLFIVYFFLIFLLIWRIAIGYFNWYGEEMMEKSDSALSEQVVPLLRRGAQLFLILIAATIVLAHFNVDLSGLIAALGVTSLAFALAAQSILSDFFSGIVIMGDQPFLVGQRIELLELDTWGDVQDIGLRSTRIRTRDNRLVIVPNSVIGKSLIVNHSVPDTHYRIQVHIGVAYGTDLDTAREVLVQAARSIAGRQDSQEPEALLVELGDDALIFRVRVWIDHFVDTRRIVDQLNSSIYTALTESGIGIPYPQRDVHHHIDTIDKEKWAFLKT